MNYEMSARLKYIWTQYEIIFPGRSTDPFHLVKWLDSS